MSISMSMSISISMYMPMSLALEGNISLSLAPCTWWSKIMVVEDHGGDDDVNDGIDGFCI